jgi:MoaA/NifB/PqqE/SkfB family radical SAM enzyme
MIDKIELFGKQIELKTHNCHLFDQEAQPVEEPYINFYIRTKFCNAKCAFCTYADDASKYSAKKLQEVFEEISPKIKIRKVAISGGEPTLYWDNFVNIVELAKKYAPDAELSMNTDGFRWKQLFEDPIYKEFDYIQLSRHHYDDTINDEIFKCKTPTFDEIKWVAGLQTHPHQIQFRCNLIKGYIDNKDEVFKFLEWSNSVDINDVGLVSLMPINDYSKENYIYFHIKELIGDNFFLTKEWKRHGGGCECFNYVYMPPEEDFRQPMKVYHKNTFMPSEIKETLVFDGQNVRLGFDGEIIY